MSLFAGPNTEIFFSRQKFHQRRYVVVYCFIVDSEIEDISVSTAISGTSLFKSDSLIIWRPPGKADEPEGG